MKIHSNFPGGNIKVLKVNRQHIQLEQEIRDSTQWWFYWSFCVKTPIACEFTFEFCNGDVIGPWGPAISFDRIHWDWADRNSRISPSAFRYRFDGTEKEVYFCFSLPYQVQDLGRFCSKYAPLDYFKREVLTKSEKGRQVPLLIIGRPEAKKYIFLSCRHHSCESVASYVLEGFLQHIVSDGSSLLLQEYQIHAAPFMDIDGVEEGDQGKSRDPHDHNRDYIKSPLYHSTSAWMEYARGKKPEIYIDLHCPFKWGEGDELSSQRNNHVFFTKRSSPIKEEVEKLGALLSRISLKNPEDSRVIFKPEYDISMGEDWFKPGAPTSSDFFEKLGARISTTCEYPYFGTEDSIITQQNSRAFGKDLAKALEEYVL